MKLPHFILIACTLLAFIAVPLRAANNILLIIADDYGIDSNSLYNTAPGANLPPTPNINALKNSGVLFRNAYSHPTCSPSRAAMLTGRHPYRTGVTTAVTLNDGLLQATEFTLPEAFAANPARGYGVASFGKWHLTIGAGTAGDPNNVGGWPHFAGSLMGAVTDYFSWTKTVNGVNATNTTYATTDTTNDVIAWIQARGTQPWFAWVGFNAPHTPFHVPPQSLHTYGTGTLSNRRKYEAAMQALDTEIGRLLASVDRAATDIIFVGDNGTPAQVIQPPYTSAHAKDTLYEGGTRVPLIIAGPDVVSPNRESTAPVHVVDLYSTILELAGIDVALTQPASNPLDAHSLLPILQNQPDTARFALAEQSGSTIAPNAAGRALRDADGYKLISFDDGHQELYRVTTDTNEATNLLAGTLSAEAQSHYSALTLQLATYVNTPAAPGGPLVTSWLKPTGAKYARIYRTQAEALAGSSVTTWPAGGAITGGGQNTVTYGGVQSVRVSANWVYLQSSALPTHVIGPWYFDAAKTNPFINWPSKLDKLVRFPRAPSVAVTKTQTTLGAIAFWVDGTIIHNQLDAFVWNGTDDESVAGGTGSWQRNARYAEGSTFDPDGAHQPNTGEHHHHISPSGLRYLLGDHMSYNPATHTYSENPAMPGHSPILGWAFDGYPIYGPYGYSDPNNLGSAVRRMVSGYVLRNGLFGTTNLAATGRTSYPQWALDIGQPTTPGGPPVSAAYPLSRYVQDFDHLADHGYTQGMDFDLDRYNGRQCRTPDFPNGTYAYFVAIEADGSPAYPYIIGRQYYGTKAGGDYGATATVGFTSAEVPNTTVFTGGANAALTLYAPSFAAATAGLVTLTWDSAEGGRYTIETSPSLTTWTAETMNIPGAANSTQRPASAPPPRGFYRVKRTSVDPYDAVATP